MKKVHLTQALVAGASFSSNAQCPTNSVKIQSNCGAQCGTILEIGPGFGVGSWTFREPTDAEAGLMQAFMNAQCLQASIMPTSS
jgi:hypothetical protein